MGLPFRLTSLTAPPERADTVRVAATTAIGIGVPVLHGAQPPRGFLCAQRTRLPQRRAVRGHLRVGRFRVAGTPTPHGPATPIGVVLAGLHSTYTENHMPKPQEALDELDLVEDRLFKLQHLCDFISAIALSARPVGAQADQIKLESLAVTFDWIHDEIAAVRDGALARARKEIKDAH